MSNSSMRAHATAETPAVPCAPGGPAGPGEPDAPGGPAGPTAPNCDKSSGSSFFLHAERTLTIPEPLLWHRTAAWAVAADSVHNATTTGKSLHMVFRPPGELFVPTSSATLQDAGALVAHEVAASPPSAIVDGSEPPPPGQLIALTFARRSMSSADSPYSESTVRVCSPTRGNGRDPSPGVRDSRGAGAGSCLPW